MIILEALRLLTDSVERVALLPSSDWIVRVLPSSVEKYSVETIAVDTLILDSCRVERVASLP